MNVNQSAEFITINIVRSVKGDNSRLKALGWKKNNSFLIHKMDVRCLILSYLYQQRF